jgi:hypothetical protein
MRMRVDRRLGAAALVLLLVAVILVARSGGRAVSNDGWLITTRQDHTATLLADGRVLFAGGENTYQQVIASTEIYDPKAGTFTETGSMTVPRELHSAVLLPDGRVLVAGGRSDANGDDIASAELYDPKTGTFSATGSMKVPRQNQTATLLADGQVLIAGEGQTKQDASAELYDPKTGTFRATGPMITPRSSHTATLLRDGTVLIVGGLGSEVVPLASAEIYDPITGRFREAGASGAGELDGTATLLYDGRVLVTGGEGGGSTTFGSVSSATIYDPATGTFSSTGSMGTPRSSHTATLLLDGRVLIAGGDDYGDHGDNSLSSAQLYDPATGTFGPTGSMAKPLDGQTATLLADGRVLLAGGDLDWQPQVYDPKTGAFGPANL